MQEEMKRKIATYKTNNNWQQIAHEFDALLTPDHQHWNDIPLLKEVGFAHSQLGNFSRALLCYERWQKIQPDSAQACYCIGYLYAQQQNYQQALEWYDRALQKYPHYFLCLYRKSICLLRLQKAKQARETVEIALQIYTSSGNDDFCKRNRKNYLKALFTLGKACFQIKKYQDALTCFHDVLQQDKKHVIKPIFKLYNLGKCYIETGDAKQAEEYLKAAMKIDERKEYLWERLGRLYHIVTMDHKRALACFNTALTCRPMAYVYVSRARLFYDMGNVSQAISDYHTALKKDKMGKHKILLELAKIAIEQKKFTEAEQYLNRAIQFKLKMYEVDYAEAHYFLAQIAFLQGDEEKGQQEIQRANEIQPDIIWNDRMMAEKQIQFYDLIEFPAEE